MTLARPSNLNAVSLSWLHPDLAQYRAAINDAAQMASDEGPATHARNVGWMQFLSTNVRCHAAGVYSVPYLHPDLCIELREYMRQLGHSVNPDEEGPAQIRECVLGEMDPHLMTQLSGLFVTVMPALAQLLFQLEVFSPLSIQGAVYTPDGTSETAWHQDIDSEFSCVVALSHPHEFTGGGTDVWRDFRQYEVPALPLGYSLLFPGRTTLHKGNHVSSGERHLLVHWVNQNLSNHHMH